MNNYDEQYRNVLKRILEKGYNTPDRTSTGVKKIFDVNISFDHKETNLFPALTLRKVFPRTSFYELKWMLSGSTNVEDIKKYNISIWDKNSSREFLDSQKLYHIKQGHIGKGYGKQFRNFNNIDQLQNVITSLENNPHSRRHMINLWNVGELNEMALPCCHYNYQFCVTGDTLNLKFNQRSSDFVLAGNQNFMFASLFLHFICNYINNGKTYKPGIVSQSIADCHIYNDHLPVAKQLLEKESKDIPRIHWNFKKGDNLDSTIEKMDWENDIELKYDSQEPIPKEFLKMSV